MMHIHHMEEINTINTLENIQTSDNPGKIGMSPN